MRNGTLSNPNRLVIINSSGQSVQGQDVLDDAAVDYQSGTAGDNEGDNIASNIASSEELSNTQATLLTFMAVSIACLTAAVATGSYAVWLARHQAARQALTDVNDILKSCQSRLQQLESDVQQLPEREA